MQEQPVVNIKKLGIIFVSIIIIIIVLSSVWHYFHTGTIVISTDNSSNTINLTVVNPQNVGAATTNTHKASGHMSVTVSLGKYDATVSNGQNTTSQLINLTGHKTLRYSINPSGLLTAQPVVNTDSQDIAVDSNQLTYLNNSTGNVNEIDSNNNLTSPISSHVFQTIKWANTSYGVGEDSEQNLYLVNGSSVNILNFPFSVNKSSVYDVAADKQLYVTSGKSVYMGNQSGSYTKIFTATSANLILGGATNKVAVAYSSDNGDEDNDNDEAIELAVVSSSGHVIKTSVGDDVTNLIWSPNNNYLVSLNESSIKIFTANLGLVATIPTSYSAGSASWLNNNEFAYAIQGKVWTYSLSSGRSNLVANLPLDTNVSGLASTGLSIYVSSINTITDSNSAVLRIDLNGQQASTIALQLQVLLPMTLSDCTISLVNFSEPPTILINPSSPGSNPDGHYIQEAQTELQQDGFNISQLRFAVD